MLETEDTIDVVLPAHNEGASIGSTLRDFYYKVALESKIPIRFVVCEDGSTDDTVLVLRQLAKEIPLKLISDPVRKGYSRAVIDGMRASESKWIVLDRQFVLTRWRITRMRSVPDSAIHVSPLRPSI